MKKVELDGATKQLYVFTLFMGEHHQNLSKKVMDLGIGLIGDETIYELQSPEGRPWVKISKGEKVSHPLTLLSKKSTIQMSENEWKKFLKGEVIRGGIKGRKYYSLNLDELLKMVNFDNDLIEALKLSYVHQENQ